MKEDMWNNGNMDMIGFAPVGAEVKTTIADLTFTQILRNLLLKSEGHLEDLGSSTHSDGLNYYKFLDEFRSTFPGRLIYRDRQLLDENESAADIGFQRDIFLFDYGAVEVNYDAPYICLRGYVTDSTFFDAMSKMAEKYKVAAKEPDRTGTVYAVIKDGVGRLALHNIGYAGITLNTNNYSTSVVEQYNEVVEDLQRKHPRGRVVILEGVPGSGKTHLVRSLLTDAGNATFVLIPPDMITELSGPTFLPLLIQYCGRTVNPIILVLEDADRCLVTRDDKNMNAIQALLNLSDGILGSMLDIRVVATTNATKLDLEPALLRPGRLSARIEVNQLSPEEATRCLALLSLDSLMIPTFEKPTTLAEVYQVARTLGWKPE